MGLNRSFWEGRRVLLTGHTGFKGSWLALWLEQLGAVTTGLSLAPEGSKPTYGAIRPNLISHQVDLRDRAGVARVVGEARPEVVLHLAAQALVRRSYADPLATYETNVQGTANLLDALRGVEGLRAVVVVTSDKVYENNEEGRPFVEGDRLGGHDPYSNSKACVELLVQCWRDSFFRSAGIGTATARAGNVIGGGDVAADRLVPDLFRALDGGVPLKLRNPQSIRPWQHVLEPLAGYLTMAERLVAGDAPDALNFGPGRDGVWTVQEVVEHITGYLGEGAWVQDGVAGPVEAKTLSLDPGAADRTIGWRPRLAITSALEWTADWWRAEREGADMRAFALGQLDRFRELMQ